MEILKIAPSRQKCRFPHYPSPNPDNAYQHSSKWPPRGRIPQINISGPPTNSLAKPAVYSPYRPQKTGKFSYSQVLCGKDVDKLRKSGGFFSSIGSDLQARMNLAPTRDCRSLNHPVERDDSGSTHWSIPTLHVCVSSKVQLRWSVN